MTDRRKFLKLSALGAGALIVTPGCADDTTETGTTSQPEPVAPPVNPVKPLVISTWNHGIQANAAAWEVLAANGYALDAVEKGVMVPESDPNNRSVGYGGLPDRTGKVTLDACIMNERSDCGAVGFLQEIKNPIAVARRVLDHSPHVMLVGKGAQQFALSQGFKKENLLVPEAEKMWREWMEKEKYTPPPINTENHDTIGMLAIDAEGRICGACTTSGAAYKTHGRLGDSPIIGAGLFLDQEVGAACATGLGEAVIRVAGSATVVELMRQGATPQEACKEIVERIIRKHDDMTNLQVGMLAINKDGEYGGYSVYEGFNYALRTNDTDKLIDAPFDRKW